MVRPRSRQDKLAVNHSHAVLPSITHDSRLTHSLTDSPVHTTTILPSVTLLSARWLIEQTELVTASLLSTPLYNCAHSEDDDLTWIVYSSGNNHSPLYPRFVPWYMSSALSNDQSPLEYPTKNTTQEYLHSRLFLYVITFRSENYILDTYSYNV